MLIIPAETTIYIYTQPVDMRKQINGFVNLLADSFDQNPQQGGLFVFTNRERRKLKILFWDRNGFVLYYKRLEKARFQYSRSLSGEVVLVNPVHMWWVKSENYIVWRPGLENAIWTMTLLKRSGKEWRNRF